MSVLWPNGQRDHTRGTCHVVTEGHFKGLCVYAWAYTCPIREQHGKTGWECYMSMMCCCKRIIVFFLLISAIKAHHKRQESFSCMLIYFIYYSLNIFPRSSILHVNTALYFIWNYSLFVCEFQYHTFVCVSVMQKVSIKKSFHGLHFYLCYLVFFFFKVKRPKAH